MIAMATFQIHLGLLKFIFNRISSPAICAEIRAPYYLTLKSIFQVLILDSQTLVSVCEKNRLWNITDCTEQ